MPDYLRRLIKAGAENPIAGALGIYVLALAVLGVVEHRLPGITAAVIEVAALVLLAASLCVTLGAPSPGATRAFLLAGANLPVLAFLLVAWLRVPGTPVPGAAAQEAMRFTAAAALYFVASYRVRRSAQLGLVRDALLGALWIISTVALLGAMIADTDTASPNGHPEILASTIAILAVFAVGQAIHAEQPGHRLAAGLGLLVAAAALMLTSEPVAWYAVAAGAGSISLLTLYATARSTRSLSRSTERQRAFVTLILVTVGVVMARPVLNSSPGPPRVNAAGNAARRGAARAAAWSAVRAHPVIGSGTGMYPYVHHPEVSRHATPDLARRRVSSDDQANSLWLQTAADVGVAGALLLVLGPVFLVAGALRRAWRMDTGIRQNLLISAAGAAVTALVDGAMSPSWQFAGPLAVFFVYLGIGSGMLRGHARGSASAQRSPWALAGAAVVLLLAPLAIATIRFAPTGSVPGGATSDEPADVAAEGGPDESEQAVESAR